jgi:transposase InsO family protein
VSRYFDTCYVGNRKGVGKLWQCSAVDGGPEFAGDFRRACERLGILRDQLPARSRNLNASLERFQGSCLHLHYRNAFRYRFNESAAEVDAHAATWLRFYNFERPHRGWRLRGPPPAGGVLPQPPPPPGRERMGSR